MNTKHKASESGQVLVLIVLTMVVLLGFTALAVDGSMVYADRRFSQSGADASSLAGGAAAALAMENSGITWNNWPCNSNPPTSTMPSSLVSASNAAKAAAISRAGDNDFAIDQDISDNHGVTTTCGSQTVGIWEDKFLDVHTLITRDTQTSFAHFVFKGIMRNTVEAVTRVRPRAPLSFGNAIVALNPSDQCTTVTEGAGFHGDTTITVNGGGILSNGCLVAKDNSLVVDVNGAGAVYRTGLNTHDANSITVDSGYSIQQMTEELAVSQYTLDPAPDCSHASAHNLTAAQFESDAKDAGGLAPGLYCVSGNVKFNNGDTATGTGVTIVLLSGDFTINGGAIIQFLAPAQSPDPTPAIPGLLIYAPPGYTGPIKLTGGAGSIFQGTILAPTADITFEGDHGSCGQLSSQIIGYNVKIGGTTAVEVNYDDDLVYTKPTFLELHK